MGSNKEDQMAKCKEDQEDKEIKCKVDLEETNRVDLQAAMEAHQILIQQQFTGTVCLQSDNTMLQKEGLRHLVQLAKDTIT